MTRPSDEEGGRKGRRVPGDAHIQQPQSSLSDLSQQPDEALEAKPYAPPPAPEAAAPADLRGKDYLKQVGAWPEVEISLWSDREVLIAEQILAGDVGALQRGFDDAPAKTGRMIRRGKLPWEVRERLHRSLTWMVLAAQLQPQARAPKVRLELVAAWTWLEPELKPQALVALLDEAQAHGDYGRSVVRDVLPSFSWPELDRFLHQAAGRGRAAWEVFVAGMEQVASDILTDPRDGHAQALRSRFAQLLTDVRVEEWVKEQLVRILRSRASPKPGEADLAWMVTELGRGKSAAEAEELARRVYVAVLNEVDTRVPNLRSWATATEWLLAHPSAVKGDPSAWHLYLTIAQRLNLLKLSGLGPERVSDYRVRALRCLAELAPIAEQVKEITKQLYERFSNPGEEPDPAVRKAAIAALARIQQRIREAPSESATRLSAPEWTSWPTPPGEAIIRFATSPRFPPLIYLPIHDSLTVSPGSGPIPLVSCMDVSQGSPGPTAAPPPDLNLSSLQVMTNGGGDGFSPARSSTAATEVHTDQLDLSSVSFSFTTEDPAVQSARLLLVHEPLELPGGIRDVGQLPAQDVVKALRNFRDPREIERFLERFVVGRTWGDAKSNYLIASGITEHLRSLKLRVGCPNDGEPSVLRCYAATGMETGSFTFEHYTEDREQRKRRMHRHVGSSIVPTLAIVPAPTDLRRQRKTNSNRSS